ncbi:MAG: NAD(+) synthase [Clostridiales Family XIII bacterium]|jgi:NAD+ synthase (glutamine-hydrolysing)|nr:NAD(+) synthase [Clostridiales Family XIII bacterium]
MFDGFIRVAAITPEVRVADCTYNASRIRVAAHAAADKGARIIVAPELSITGYTCGDLFLQDELLESAKAALIALAADSEGRDEIVIVGLPLAFRGKLYNVAAVYSDGVIHGIIPKSFVPNYGEFYELRHFTPADGRLGYITLPAPPEKKREEKFGDDDYFESEDAFADIPFGTRILFECEEDPEFIFAVEICEDLWAAEPPSVLHACTGAKIIANLSAGNETIGKASYRRLLAQSQSGRLVCGYIYSNAGFGESSTDVIFAGHSIIAENGVILSESAPFADGISISEIDVKGLTRDRRYLNSFEGYAPEDEGYERVYFSQKVSPEENVDLNGKVIPINKAESVYSTGNVKNLYRHIDSHPFVPANPAQRAERCEEILNMQSAGLAKRLLHTGSRSAVLGISGGLDSTLALLVTVRAMKKAGKPLSDITAVTMPGFGTTGQTKDNAHKLCGALGVTVTEIDITESVKVHLKSIGHAESDHSNVYENAQARIRTLILMDLANKTGGLVVGTGDLSELALGWATYNGDHMSMYGVNAGVPKSLVRHIIRYVADTDPGLRDVLTDVLGTPVSPELLPPEEGEIAQKTEELIGPYELHDFFLYHMIRWGRRPKLIFELAKYAFSDANKRADIGGAAYDAETILKWLKVFYRRFFANQFKRSALPDGPKIGSVSLSPRGDWRMPSDADAGRWLKELEKLN